MPVQGPPISSFGSCPKTVTFAAVAVGNAILTSFATAATPSVVTSFTGAQAGGPFSLPRTVSVTTAAHAGSYTIGAPNAIVIKGTDAQGTVIQDTLTLTATGGGETIVSAKSFVTVTEIDIPAQNDTSGSFTFGVRDVVWTFRRLRIGGAGAVHYQCQLDGTTDTIPAGVVGEWMPIVGIKLFGDSATTATNITLGA